MKTTSSPSTMNQRGATWGSPTRVDVATFPVRAPSARKARASSSDIVRIAEVYMITKVSKAAKYCNELTAQCVHPLSRNIQPTLQHASESERRVHKSSGRRGHPSRDSQICQPTRRPCPAVRHTHARRYVGVDRALRGFACPDAKRSTVSLSVSVDTVHDRSPCSQRPDQLRRPSVAHRRAQRWIDLESGPGASPAGSNPASSALAHKEDRCSTRSTASGDFQAGSQNARAQRPRRGRRRDTRRRGGSDRS